MPRREKSRMTLEKLNQRNQEIAPLKALWLDLLPGEQPSPSQFHLWLDLHPLARVVLGVRQTAKKQETLPTAMSLEHRVRFCSKVANDAKRNELASQNAPIGLRVMSNFSPFKPQTRSTPPSSAPSCSMARVNPAFSPRKRCAKIQNCIAR